MSEFSPLRRGLLLAGAAALASKMLEAVPTVEAQQRGEVIYPLSTGNQFAVDIATNTPTKLFLLDGQTVMIDQNRFNLLRRRGMQTAQSEVMEIYRSASTHSFDFPYKPTKERPVYSEKPKDAVSEDELKARGIKIIQPPSGEMMCFRSSAFDSDGTLSEYPIGTDRRLTYVLVDSPFNHPSVMTDSRYDGYREMWKEVYPAGLTTFKEVQSDRAITLQIEIDSLRSRLRNMQGANMVNFTDLDLWLIESIISQFKEKLEMTEKATSVKDIFAEWIRKPGTNVPFKYEKPDQGRYFEPDPSNPAFASEAVTCIPVGDAHQKFDQVVIRIQKNGQYSLADLRGLQNQGQQPLAVNACPNPFRYEVVRDWDESKENFLLPTYELSRVIRHETSHDKLIAGRKAQGLDPEYDEKLTDMIGTRRMINNYRYWEASGFTDNRKFEIGLKIPDGNWIVV